jgi:hypothetical protein
MTLAQRIATRMTDDYVRQTVIERFVSREIKREVAVLEAAEAWYKSLALNKALSEPEKTLFEAIEQARRKPVGPMLTTTSVVCYPNRVVAR